MGGYDGGYDMVSGSSLGAGGTVMAQSKPLLVKYAGKEEMQSDNCYIAGIPNGIGQEGLGEIFRAAGCTVKRTRIMHDAMGTGFSAGMVQLGSAQEAEHAIAALKGQIVEIEVSADGSEGGPGGMKGGGGGGWGGGKGDKGGKAWGGDKGGGKGWGGDKGGGFGWGAEPAWDGGGGGWDSKGKGCGKGGGKASGMLNVVYNGRDHSPNDNIYITGLPASVTQQALRDVLVAYGLNVARIKVINDNRDPTLIFAVIVQMGSQEEAAAAIQALHGQKCDDVFKVQPKPLMVKYSGREEQPSENLYITGLPSAVDDTTLGQIFVQSGFTVVRAKIIQDSWGTGYSAGMVTVGSQEEAAAAITALTGQVVELEEPEQPAGNQWAPQAKGGWGGGKGGKGGKGVFDTGYGKGGFDGGYDGGFDGGKGFGKDGKGEKGAVKGPPSGLADDPNYMKPLKIQFAGRDRQASENLYITGLPSFVDGTTLTQMFEAAGLTVQRAKIFTDAWGCGYSAGMATMGSVEEAKAAIDAFNGQVIDKNPAQ